MLTIALIYYLAYCVVAKLLMIDQNLNGLEKEEEND